MTGNSTSTTALPPSTTATPPPTTLDPAVVNLAKAIREQETGGQWKASGASGESGAYQWLPGTWQTEAKQYLGDPNAPLTPDNQNQVAYKRIKAWKDQGYKPDQIASLWNHGSPDYQGVVGDKFVNGKKVHYDTPSYVKNVMNYYQKYKSQTSAPGSISASLATGAAPSTAPISSDTTPPPTTPNKGFFGNALSALAGAAKDSLGQQAENWKGAAKGLGSTINYVGGLGAQGLEALTGMSPTLAAGAGSAGAQPKPGILTPHGTAQNIGFGAEQVGEFFIPGLGEEAAAGAAAKAVEGAPALIQKAAPLLAKSGVGAADIAARTIAQGGTPKQALQGAVLGGAAPLVGGVLGKLGGKIAPALEESAARDYTKALKPTTNENKAIAAKIVPELIGKKVIGTRGSLMEKFESKAATAGEEIGKKAEAIPDSTVVPVQPVIDELEKAKQELMITGKGGKQVAADPDKVASIEAMQKQLKSLGDEVSWGSMRKFRQVLDRNLARSKAFFGKTLAEGSKLDIQRTAAGAMRDILAKDHPDIDALNKEFSFWSNAEKVLGDTIQRTKGHETPLVEKAAGAGAVFGSLFHKTAVIPAVILDGLLSFSRSALWRTTSAVVKNDIAKSLASGDFEKISKLIAKATQGVSKNLP